jgi:hypothetical protein
VNGTFRLFAVSALSFAIALAVLVAPWADGDPDGLTKVAREEGFAGAEQRHALDGSPVAGYAVEGVENERVSTGLAGLAGVLTTFGVMVLILAVVRRGRTRRVDEPEEPG